jgi:hypothetical protein
MKPDAVSMVIMPGSKGVEKMELLKLEWKLYEEGG